MRTLARRIRTFRLVGKMLRKTLEHCTNKWLQDVYRRANRECFKNRLSKDIKVQWGKCGTDMGWTLGKRLIIVNRRLKAWPRAALMVLFHEMVHIRLPGVGHGDRFQKEMRRLARIGAFRYLW